VRRAARVSRLGLAASQHCQCGLLTAGGSLHCVMIRRPQSRYVRLRNIDYALRVAQFLNIYPLTDIW